MTPLIHRLTGEDAFPILLIGGKPIRGSDVPKLVESGELPKMLREAGVRMAAPGKKKKGH